MVKQFIIIGNSAAGIAAVEAIRKRDKASKITVISDEEYSAYCRCLITAYLSGEIKEEQVFFRPQDFYKANNIELLLNKKVARVDPKKNRIVLEDKAQLGYDALMIATGARPKFPELKGIKRTGVFGFRTLKDAQNISGLLPVTKTVCVLGGGLIGLKAAYALKKRNIDVKVIIKSRQVLSQLLDSEAAGFVQQRLESHGIEVLLGQDAAEIIGEGDIKAVKLDSGKAIGCSMVIVGKGVSPNIELIKETQVQSNEGIIANNLLQTSVPNIFTGGDSCESFDITLGEHTINALWPVAVEQGKIAGANMAGDSLNYEGSVGMNSVEFFGLPIVSLGIYKIKEGNAAVEELKLNDAKRNLYKKLILENNILVGAILVGDIKNSGVFLRLIRERVDVSPFKSELLGENFGYPTIKDFVKTKERFYV
ncbi:MAG: FAD-dependent oxidoreductase [Candidatus Omnitrophica bacterium]|nr:FAD-dependent oxidoreductase [Candidatus Omnitrophota bacterium]